jgi:hypothetical protein
VVAPPAVVVAPPAVVDAPPVVVNAKPVVVVKKYPMVVVVASIALKYGLSVVPGNSPSGVSSQGSVVGPGVVDGLVKRNAGGGRVGGGVIFQSGGGPRVGNDFTVSPGRLGTPGSGFAGTGGSGGGGPGSGGGGGGASIGPCAAARAVVVVITIGNIGDPEPHGPVVFPWQLHALGKPRCLFSQPK